MTVVYYSTYSLPINPPCHPHCASINICHCNQKATLGHGLSFTRWCEFPAGVHQAWTLSTLPRPRGAMSKCRATEKVPWAQCQTARSPGQATLWACRRAASSSSLSEALTWPPDSEGRKQGGTYQNSSIPGGFANPNPPQIKICTAWSLL